MPSRPEGDKSKAPSPSHFAPAKVSSLPAVGRSLSELGASAPAGNQIPAVRPVNRPDTIVFLTSVSFLNVCRLSCPLPFKIIFDNKCPLTV